MYEEKIRKRRLLLWKGYCVQPQCWPVCSITVSLPSADFCGLTHSMRLANADSLLSSERSRSSCPYAHAHTHVQSLLNTTNTAQVTPQLLHSYRRLLKETQILIGKYSIFMSGLMLTFQNPVVISYTTRLNIKNFPYGYSIQLCFRYQNKVNTCS